MRRSKICAGTVVTYRLVVLVAAPE